MVTRLRRISPVQFALVVATIYAFIALIIVLVWLPFATLVAAMVPSSTGRWFGAGLGVVALVVWPIAYFIIMFIGGLITAALYNLVAGWTGGIEVTLEQTASTGMPAGAATI
ncbi:MAG TPA: hypothetical protein VFN37_10455 [Candidatus Baltobacteraceae bacterium]|nr:hypothetical protein [Candidatus Baltobacteraceae bacterium]